MENKNIPINKGNYSFLEPEERIERFESIRGAGWELEYAEYRKKWSENPKKQVVDEYPIQVDLELSNICNLKCPMCFRTTNDYNKKPNVKHMDFELAKKVIGEIKGKVPALRLSFRGESTLHPNIVEIIALAKKSGIKEVSFLTNGSKLTKELVGEFVLAGLDWITVSIDGVDEVYNKIRKPLKFDQILDKIKTTQQVKKDMGSEKPVIKVQSLWPAIRENPQEYYDIFAPHVDMIAFNPIIDYLDNDSENSIQFIDDFSCPQHYQRLIVSATGNALMCTNDEHEQVSLGDANIQTVHEIWHGEKLTEMRKVHCNKNGFKDIDVCRHCFIPRATEDSEVAVVNGRNIHIPNYTNRAQVIGK